MKQQKKTRSIGEKMKFTHTYQRQEEILLAWADAWEKDFNKTHDLIRMSIKERDIDSAMRYSDQLRALTEKRFLALENIIHKVCDPERIMKDAEAAEDIQIHNPIPKPEVQSLEDRVMLQYKQGNDVRKIADMCDISYHKAVKILVTAGIFHSDTYDRIRRLQEDGKTNEEICDILAIKASTLDRYLPYKKGRYLSETPSENAIKIRKSRKRAGTGC